MDFIPICGHTLYFNLCNQNRQLKRYYKHLLALTPIHFQGGQQGASELHLPGRNGVWYRSPASTVWRTLLRMAMRTTRQHIA